MTGLLVFLLGAVIGAAVTWLSLAIDMLRRGPE